MKKMIPILCVCIAWVASGVYGQCPGDECSYAMTAYSGGNSFDTTCATPSSPIPDDSMCEGTYLDWGTTNPDVWFSFTPTTSGTYLFTTCDSKSFDTSMVLYEGSCSQQTQIACNGDGSENKFCQQFHSEIQIALNANTEYFVRIGGYFGDFGVGTLSIDQVGGGNSVWYVNGSNTNKGNGTSWDLAFLQVQEALDVASSGDQIWIAQGVYTPTDTGGTSDPRDATLQLAEGVEIYGGFFGNETNVDDRLPTTYRVFLSGDLDGDDDSGGDNSENAYNVLTAKGLSGIPPILDGVHIVAGNANNTSIKNYGGGLIVRDFPAGSTSYPLVQRCHFVSNNATIGGAVSVSSSNEGVSLIHCTFAKNSAERGGAIYNEGYASVDNCLIVANTADVAGAAIYTNGIHLGLVNTTISQNTAGFIGGIYLASGAVGASNNILWGNQDLNGNNSQLHIVSGQWSGDYNCIQNYDASLGGIHNIDNNPRFINELGDDGERMTGDEDFHLLQQSPCIDAGDNSAVTVAVDLDGDDRIIDDPYTDDSGNCSIGNCPIVDMGSDEHVPGTNSVSIWSETGGSYFGDYLNWLPNGVPGIDGTALFNVANTTTVSFQEFHSINKLFVTGGDVTFDLSNQTLALLSDSDSMRIIPFDMTSHIKFVGFGGILRIDNLLQLNHGHITFSDGVFLDAPDGIVLHEGVSFNLDGYIQGNITNDGGAMLPGGRNIGSMHITGDLLHGGSKQPDGEKNPIGSLLFDINGYDKDGTLTWDRINVSGTADMQCALEISWNTNYPPQDGEWYDLITAGSIIGQPMVIYCSNVPSSLRCKWQAGNGLISSEGVVVETTGPILFDSGTSTSISVTPSDIVVADLDGVNGSDVALALPDAIGGAGTIVILFNNGMSGNTWQGFTASSPITIGIDPRDLEVGDLNGDGTANDLVVANYGDNNVSVLSNDGSGTFTKIDVATDAQPLHIAIANYVEDGLVLDDIVVACDSFLATVLQNTSSLNAQGMTFTDINSINIPQPADLNPGDVNDDKDFDFILLDGANEEIKVLEGTGTGSTPIGFVIGNPLPSGSAPVQFEFADLNSDGADDAITVNEGDGSLSVLLGDLSELGSASSMSVGTSPQSITIHDFDNDGDDDLVISVIGDTSGNRELLIIRNDTSGIVVLTAGDTAGSGSEPILVQHGDFNQDGLEDLACIIDLAPLAGANSPAVGIYMNSTAVVNPCVGDVDDDGFVAVGDILALIAAWGSADPDLDIDGSGLVDVGDILLVVANWGACS